MEATLKYPLTLKSRFGKVKIYRVRGRFPTFTVVWNAGRQRCKKSYVDEKAAYAHASKVLETIEAGEARVMTTDVRDIAYYKECEQMLGGTIPLKKVIEFYIACNGAPGFEEEAITKDVIEEFLDDADKRGVSERDYSTLKHHLTGFSKCHGTRPIIAVKARDIDEYLQANRKWSNRTRNNHRISLVRCWKWARNKGYLPKGIDTAAAMSSCYKAEQSDQPGIFKPEEVAKLFEHVSDDWLPNLAIRAFAGLRTAESLRLDWSQVRLDEKIIVLGRTQTKTNKRRIAHMPDNLVEWLRPFAKEQGPVAPSTRTARRVSKDAADAAGVKWVHNGLRHSYISYQMALLRNAPEVAEQCGNSESEVQRSYKALASEAEAKKYFAIFPTTALTEPHIGGTVEQPHKSNERTSPESR